MKKWSRITLDTVAEKIAMGPFGSDIKVETFVKKGVPIISGGHLRGIKLKDQNYNFISEDHADRLKGANVFRGDVIFTHAGNIGQVAYIPQNSQYEKYVISQRQFYLRCDKTKLLPEFIVYYFKTRFGQHQLLANANQTGVPSIARPVSYLKSIEIELPTLAIQQCVVNILLSLDEKIELLQEQNKTLEEIAQRLFKEWFVDFNFPGSDGKPYKASGGKMVESDMGKIPEGWSIDKLGSIVDVKGGTTPSTKESRLWNGEYFWTSPKDLSNCKDIFLRSTEKKVTADGLSKISSGLLPVGTVLLSSRAPIGYLAITDIPVAINQGYIAITPRQDYTNYFIYLWVKCHLDSIIAAANGSTFLEISKSSFKNIEIVKPSKEVVLEFQKIVRPIFEKIAANEEQNIQLSTLREVLLPKLMSGEIAFDRE